MKINDLVSTFREITTIAAPLFCLGAAFLLQTGCASTSSSSPQASITSQHQTFAISMLNPQGTPYEQSRVAQLAPVAVEAVNTSLTGKGYREAPAENADLLVRLGGKFSPDFKSEVARTTGQITSTVTPESSQHRVLLMEILDNRTKKTLWSDSRSSTSAGTVPPDRLRAIVTEMLAPFPKAGGATK